MCLNRKCFFLLSFDAEQWWWRLWANGERWQALCRLIDKVSKLSLKSTFSMSRAVWHYIYLACVCYWHLWGQNSFGDVHKTANIQYYVVPEMFWNCKSRQNVHLVHYHIDECWTDQRFWEIVADDILRNYFPLSITICPHFWPRTHQIDLIKLSCSQLIKKI